uniref:Uncharacterized protein n=1 Tax=Romanomermis culicivorax TaxID=13658 RepID=A0A915JES6_ROMCU
MIRAMGGKDLEPRNEIEWNTKWFCNILGRLAPTTFEIKKGSDITKKYAINLHKRFRSCIFTIIGFAFTKT